MNNTKDGSQPTNKALAWSEHSGFINAHAACDQEVTL